MKRLREWYSIIYNLTTINFTLQNNTYDHPLRRLGLCVAVGIL